VLISNLLLGKGFVDNNFVNNLTDMEYHNQGIVGKQWNLTGWLAHWERQQHRNR